VAPTTTATCLRDAFIERASLVKRLTARGVYKHAKHTRRPAPSQPRAGVDEVRKPPDAAGRSERGSGHGPGSRRVLPGDRASRHSVRRLLLHRGPDDRYLLPTRLPGAHAPVGARDLLSHGRRGPGGGLPPVPT